MKIYSSALTDYRAAKKAHGQVNLIPFRVKDIDDPNSQTWCRFASADEDMTVTVTDPDTGVTDDAVFAGGGHIVKVGDLVRSEKTVVRSHVMTLSGASGSVLDMVHGFNCRAALVQWFIGELDQDSGLLVDEPPCEFVGMINTIDVSDGALDIDGLEPAESEITVTVDSIGAALAARNYDMRSLDVSQARSGDLFFEHGDSAHHWVNRWAKTKKRERDGKGGGKGHGGGKQGNNAGGTGRVKAN